MKQMQNFPLESRGETVSREALVQAALQEITQNYREASLSNVARTYGVSLAYVSECVRAQTGKTYKELLQKHRMETAARLLRRSDLNIQQIITQVGYRSCKWCAWWNPRYPHKSCSENRWRTAGAESQQQSLS